MLKLDWCVVNVKLTKREKASNANETAKRHNHELFDQKQQ